MTVGIHHYWCSVVGRADISPHALCGVFLAQLMMCVMVFRLSFRAATPYSLDNIY